MLLNEDKNKDFGSIVGNSECTTRPHASEKARVE